MLKLCCCSITFTLGNWSVTCCIMGKFAVLVGFILCSFSAKNTFTHNVRTLKILWFCFIFIHMLAPHFQKSFLIWCVAYSRFGAHLLSNKQKLEAFVQKLFILYKLINAFLALNNENIDLPTETEAREQVLQTHYVYCVHILYSHTHTIRKPM